MGLQGVTSRGLDKMLLAALGLWLERSLCLEGRTHSKHPCQERAHLLMGSEETAFVTFPGGFPGFLWLAESDVSSTLEE